MYNVDLVEEISSIKMIQEYYLLLGSNIGDRLENLAYARQKITSELGEILKSSAFYESEPWGYHSNHKFVNQVLILRSTMEPSELLVELQKIENKKWRDRDKDGYKDRLLDIDILFCGNRIIKSTNLVIPHPGIPYRRFVLTPLVELAPGFLHPGINVGLQELLDKCDDKGAVNILDR
jgi:2-amino-4-hydroxy-6-hydroxymethyldihydropteridine diphosphokinase